MRYDLTKNFFDMDVFARLELAEDQDIKDVISGTKERPPEPGSVYEKILKL